MPLVCGDVSRNISDMRHAGHGQPQAVAASMRKERECQRKNRRKRSKARRARRSQR
jgi:hypothetical protein